MDQRISQWVCAHPALAFLFMLLLVGSASAGLEKVKFDADVRTHFSSDDPQRLALESLEIQFGRLDNLVIAVETSSDDLFNHDDLSALEELTNIAWQIPHSSRVDALTNYQYSWSFADELVVEPLIENSTSKSQADIEELKRIALSEPSLLHRLVSITGKDAALNITINYPEGERQLYETEVTYYLRDALAQFEERHPQLKTHFTGITISNTTAFEIIASDMQTTIPAMYLFIFVCLGYLLRSFVAVAAVFLVTSISTMSALGIAGWVGITLNSLSVTATNVIITVTIAHCVHLLSTYYQQYSISNNKQQALQQSLVINLQPVFLTSLTTAIGFFSMNMTELPAYRDFGNIVGFGVIFAFLLSYTFLPGFLLLLPVKTKQSGIVNISAGMSRFGNLVLEHRKKLLLLSLALSCTLAALSTQNVINERYMDFINEGHQFTDDNQYIDEHFGAIYALQYAIDAGLDGNISNPDYLKSLDQLTTWLRQQPEVTNVYSYSDVIKRLNKNMHSDDEKYYQIPENQALASQYLLLYEMSLPYGQDLSRMINHDKSSTHLIVTFPSMDSVEVFALQRKIQTWMASNIPTEMHHPGTSFIYVMTHVASTALENSLKGAAFALMLITLVLMVALRSVKFGLISIIPNIFPAGVGFGIWYLYSGELGLNLCVVVGITIGIVVDDTVHFLTKYLRARREHGLSPEEAIRNTFNTVGPALWITSLMLAGGFALMAISEFIANFQVGALTAIVITAALVLDFILLPTILLALDKKRYLVSGAINETLFSEKPQQQTETQTKETEAMRL